ncbi:hypothetical protein NEDG_01244 [Nematocida displodere]|uniref:Uncharacterized protein n=1 Tax=Nematocida displodere TaxID=1805483 RepID=A0A177EAZ5_9MICR|nr:hypothetical protein NEDG_01244 [Nematocida displodere]
MKILKVPGKGQKKQESLPALQATDAPPPGKPGDALNAGECPPCFRSAKDAAWSRKTALEEQEREKLAVIGQKKSAAEIPPSVLAGGSVCVVCLVRAGETAAAQKAFVEAVWERVGQTVHGYYPEACSKRRVSVVVMEKEHLRESDMEALVRVVELRTRKRRGLCRGAQSVQALFLLDLALPPSFLAVVTWFAPEQVRVFVWKVRLVGASEACAESAFPKSKALDPSSGNVAVLLTRARALRLAEDSQTLSFSAMPFSGVSACLAQAPPSLQVHTLVLEQVGGVRVHALQTLAKTRIRALEVHSCPGFRLRGGLLRTLPQLRHLTVEGAPEDVSIEDDFFLLDAWRLHTFVLPQHAFCGVSPSLICRPSGVRATEYRVGRGGGGHVFCLRIDGPRGRLGIGLGSALWEETALWGGAGLRLPDRPLGAAKELSLEEALAPLQRCFLEYATRLATLEAFFRDACKRAQPIPIPTPTPTPTPQPNLLPSHLSVNIWMSEPRNTPTYRHRAQPRHPTSPKPLCLSRSAYRRILLGVMDIGRAVESLEITFPPQTELPSVLFPIECSIFARLLRFVFRNLSVELQTLYTLHMLTVEISGGTLALKGTRQSAGTPWESILPEQVVFVIDAVYFAQWVSGKLVLPHSPGHKPARSTDVRVAALPRPHPRLFWGLEASATQLPPLCPLCRLPLLPAENQEPFHSIADPHTQTPLAMAGKRSVQCGGYFVVMGCGHFSCWFCADVMYKKRLSMGRERLPPEHVRTVPGLVQSLCADRELSLLCAERASKHKFTAG